MTTTARPGPDDMRAGPLFTSRQRALSTSFATADCVAVDLRSVRSARMTTIDRVEILRMVGTRRQAAIIARRVKLLLSTTHGKKVVTPARIERTTAR